MMKSVFFLNVVLFILENVVSKSILLHQIDDIHDELEDNERWRLKTESGDWVSWKRLQESVANSEESNSGNDFFMQKPTSQQMMNENEDMTEKALAFENENEITFEKQPFLDNSLAEIWDGPEIFEGPYTITIGTGLDQLSSTSLSVESEPRNLTNAIIVDFSNITGDAIVLDTLTENAEADLDEVSEMSKGEEIAFLHEMPTSSFEFLIDAQTRRNILLKELLGSQTLLSVEEDDIQSATLRELEHSLSATDLHSRGNNFEELTLNDTAVPVGDKSEDEMAGKDIQHETTATFAEIELRDSSENIVPECPQPGWCFLWFLSQDTCAINSHCLGSRICCKTGCSKTCVDV